MTFIISGLFGGFVIAAGVVWAWRVCRRTGWAILSPVSNWDAKLDVALGLGCAAVGLLATPMQAMVLAGAAVGTSCLLRVGQGSTLKWAW